MAVAEGILKVAALIDIKRRPASQIRGPKWVWAPVVAVVNSAGVIPAGAHAPLQHASVFLVAVALSAIGLSTNVAALRKAGHRPLLLGALLWITVAAASLGLQAVTGTL